MNTPRDGSVYLGNQASAYESTAAYNKAMAQHYADMREGKAVTTGDQTNVRGIRSGNVGKQSVGTTNDVSNEQNMSRRNLDTSKTGKNNVDNVSQIRGVSANAASQSTGQMQGFVAGTVVGKAGTAGANGKSDAGIRGVGATGNAGQQSSTASASGQAGQAGRSTSEAGRAGAAGVGVAGAGFAGAGMASRSSGSDNATNYRRSSELDVDKNSEKNNGQTRGSDAGVRHVSTDSSQSTHRSQNGESGQNRTMGGTTMAARTGQNGDHTDVIRENVVTSGAEKSGSENVATYRNGAGATVQSTDTFKPKSASDSSKSKDEKDGQTSTQERSVRSGERSGNARAGSANPNRTASESSVDHGGVSGYGGKEGTISRTGVRSNDGVPNAMHESVTSNGATDKASMNETGVFTEQQHDSMRGHSGSSGNSESGSSAYRVGGSGVGSSVTSERISEVREGVYDGGKSGSDGIAGAAGATVVNQTTQRVESQKNKPSEKKKSDGKSDRDSNKPSSKSTMSRRHVTDNADMGAIRGVQLDTDVPGSSDLNESEESGMRRFRQSSGSQGPTTDVTDDEDFV